jgi:DNA-binding transcriptional MocR family regulator
VDTISLARGVPASELLATADLADCARSALERDGAIALNYGPVGGYAPLREWLAERHGVKAASILLTNGSLQGLDLIVQRFAGERRVLVEAPTYDRALAIGRRHGAAMHAVEHDAEGLDPDALQRELGRDSSPAFLYLLPTFQNPTGRTLPLDRRQRIVELATAHDLVVLEDDPYRRVRFEGEDITSLHELAGGDRVLYSSSFSKIVAPGLRVGYLVVPEALGAELERTAVGTYLAPTFPTQAIVHEFLSRGLLDANVARVSELLRARRDALVAALEARLPEATWTTPEGGYFLWLRLPGGIESRLLLDAAEERGVTFVLGGDFYLDGGGADAARLAFSYPSPAELGEAGKRLAAALAAVAP